MKNLLLSILLLPFAAFGQKFEISEQAGICGIGSLDHVGMNGQASDGYSNQLTFGYHVSKHFVLNGYYERNSYKKNVAPGYENSWGISPEYTFHSLYLGLDAKLVSYSKIDASQNYEGVRYNTSFGYGAHIGLKQKIGRHMFVLEQAGYQGIYVRGSVFDGATVGGPVSQDSDPRTNFTSLRSYSYLRVGVGYRFL